MKLRKPMHGLCDAARAWFLGARERLANLGAEQHPLDACLFLLYDYQAPHSTWTYRTDSKGAQRRHPPLTALMGIHVDDIIAAVDKTNKTYQTFEQKLKQSFTFRTWEEDKDFDYCGAQVRRLAPDHYTLEHQQYITKQKQKPVTVDNKEDDDRPVTEKGRSSLRAVIGALQWPAGQSSPRLQAAISQLAGQVSKATVATLREANKTLRYAKSNSDVCVSTSPTSVPLLEDLTFLTYCDAAFASRPDNTSQGGYLVMLVHHSVTTGQEGPYNLVDWRSWKLPIRSMDALESQTVEEAQTEDRGVQTEAPEEEECVQCLRWKDWVEELTREHMADHAAVFREHEANLDAAQRGRVQATADRDRLQERLNQSLETIKKLKEQNRRLTAEDSKRRWTTTSFQDCNEEPTGRSMSM